MLAICHTFYSLQTGVRSPQDWAREAAARGYSSLAVADVDGLYGAVHFHQAVAAAGLQPLIGATLTLGGGRSCVVLAESATGYRQLCRLLSARHLQQPFNLENALLTAGTAALVFLATAPEVLLELCRYVSRQQLYRLPAAPLPATPTGHTRTPSLWEPLASGLPVAATPDAWLLEEADRETFTLLRRLRQLSGRDRLPDMPPTVLPAAADWRRQFPDQHAADELAARCRFRFELGTPIFPKINLPDGLAPATYLTQVCREALGQKYPASAKPRPPSRPTFTIPRKGDSNHGPDNDRIPGDTLPCPHTPGRWQLVGAPGTAPRLRGPAADRQSVPGPTVPGLAFRRAAESAATAAARLQYELDMISRQGFADYFLYVREIVAFAQSRGIPVEVRGSAASSLVSYLLGFTHCCPLEHDLCFERFLNPGRKDCPDIDLDIADNRRDEVIAFCYRRWGEGHVAMVATVNTYREAGAVWDAARLLGVKPGLLKAAVAAAAAGAEGIAANPVAAQLQAVAQRLIGLPRHLGVHCGGLVITPCPSTDLTPLARAAKGVVISHFEKDQAAMLGLVKMDLLGNSALSVIDEGCALLKARGVEFAEPGPPHDFKVRRLFSNGDTLGVYQCESPGMRQLCRALEPASARETAAALSLIRPGPGAAGMKETFIRRKLGLEPIRYLHPGMATFLSGTYGVMLYQEDVMKVAVNLAGYTPADADVLRRAVSKARDPAVLAREHDRFVIEKAAAAGVDAATANVLWEQVSRFAAYSFCKAHATVYGRLAWLTARLRAHYPQEFFTAVLNHHKSMYPLRVFVWEAIRHGIPVMPPDVQAATLHWTPVARGIRAGLDRVRGLRNSVARQLVGEAQGRPFRDLADLRQRVPFQAGELERLILAGACRQLGAREALLAELQATGGNALQLTFADAFRGASPAADGLAAAPLTADAGLPSLYACELALLGIPFVVHPADLAPPGTCQAADLPRHVNETVELVGILDTWRSVRTKADKDGVSRRMGFVTLEDATGIFELVLFPEAFRAYAALFAGLGPYRVRGTVTLKWGSIILELLTAGRC